MADNNQVNRTKSTHRKLFDTNIPRIYDRPLIYTPDKYLTQDRKLPTIGFDPQMQVNIYGSGTLMTALQTIATSILRLLYTVPGQFPDYPEMGIDIRRYLFSFEDEFTAASLREEILKQLPLLDMYISDTEAFQVIKTEYAGNPCVIIKLVSSYRNTNGFEEERIMNIGITFDEFHKLTSDISFAFNGDVKHFSHEKYNIGG